jgi:hypothetical protein
MLSLENPREAKPVIKEEPPPRRVMVEPQEEKDWVEKYC